MIMRDPRRPARALCLAGLAILAACPGCDPGPPAGKHPVQPVEGRVLLEGKPVANALVSFHPVDEAKFGTPVPRPAGRTDDDGRFRLMTYYEGDGAPEGDYLVGIAGLSRPQAEAGNILEAAKSAVKVDVLGGRFLDPKASGVKATVKPGPNALPPFELKATGGAAISSDGRGR